MDDLKTFAKLPEILEKYPLFYKHLLDFDNLIGLKNVKDNIANKIKYIIMSNKKAFTTQSIHTRSKSKSKRKSKKRSKKRKRNVNVTKFVLEQGYNLHNNLYYNYRDLSGTDIFYFS